MDVSGTSCFAKGLCSKYLIILLFVWADDIYKLAYGIIVATETSKISGRV